MGISADGVTNYEVIDVFDNQSLGIISPDQTMTVRVNPTGESSLLHIPLPSDKWRVYYWGGGTVPFSENMVPLIKSRFLKNGHTFSKSGIQD